MLIFSRTVCVLAEVFWSFFLNSRFIMMMRWLLLFWIAVAGLCGAPAKDCMQFVQKIMTGKIDQDLREILPFVMYSGITANNPGQKYECQHTALGSKYNYFLVNWKNTTSTTDTFTGLCVPEVCNKEEIEKALQTLSVKNSKVYDYPSDAPTDALFVVCAVFVGIWVGVLTLWSIVISCRSPVQNELIKKNEEKVPDDPERPINSLMSERTEKEDFKLFNFYEGYCRIFHRTNKKNFIAPIFFLAAFSIIAGKQFSLRQTIAANEAKSLRWFDSFGGVMFCNLEIAFNVIMFALGLKLAYSLYKLSSFHQIGRFFFDQLLTKWATLVLVTMAAYFLLCFTDEPLNQLWRNTAVSDCPSVIYQVWFVFRSLQFNGKACLPWFWVPEADIFMTILAAPFFIIYKTKKPLGFALFALLIVTSMIAGYAVLDSQSVLFEPYKLFNMSRDFTINYQTNAIVRIWPYFIGFIFGLIINESIEKEGHEEREHHNHGLVKLVRRNQKVQLGLHFAGFGLMLAMYLLIIPYLKVAEVGETRKDAYGYIIFAPFGFLIGLMLFLLPCFLQGENKLTVLVSKALNAGVWDSLDKMTLAFLGLGPVVIGFTTYSMQNSIYFDFQTVLIYFLGDAVIIYILALLIVAGIVNQLQFISKWVQSKVFKTSSNYSVLVLED